jgi:amino acid adenylation domain-containing protein
MNEEIKQRLENLSPAQRALLNQKIKQKQLQTITKRQVNHPVPLSFAQERMWFLDQLNPDTSAYNRPTNIKFAGELNVAALEQSLNAIIHRHEILRTCFPVINEKPVQQIAPHFTLSLPVIDLSHLSIQERDIEVEKLAIQAAQQSFDLSQLPLIKGSLLKLAAQEHLLLLTLHHTIFDGWSFGVLLEELAEFYQAFVTKKPASLPELPIQYADFTQWQRNWLQGEVVASQLNYWKEKLGGSLPVLQLPTDYPRPAIQTYNGAAVSLELSPDLTTALKTLSEQQGITLFMTLLAAFQVLLHRYSGEEDIIVGTPIANRNRQEIEPLIGCFVNSLVLRTDLGGNPTFTELLQRVREVTLGAYTHQDLPFEKLVEELQPERDLSRHPLFQVWFNMLNLAETKLELTDVKLEKFVYKREIASKFDLTLYVDNKDHKIGLKFVYNTTLFNGDTIEEMSQHFQQLLAGITRKPEAAISSFSLLSKTASVQLSARRNLIQPSNPFEKFLKSEIQQSIPARFQKQVNKYPDKIAIKTKNYQWTYEQLNLAANHIAQKLLQHTPQEQTRIALLFEHDAPMVAAILAVLKLGQIYVPLDPNYPQERGSYILEDSLASLVLTNDENLDYAQSLAKGKLPIINTDQIEKTQVIAEINCQISWDTIAYLLYTSGSTGKPKGVIQTHENVLHFIRIYTNNLQISCQDNLTLLSYYGFDAAVMGIFGALLNGATLCPFDIKKEGIQILGKWLKENKITIYHSTPTVYRYFLDYSPERKQLEAIRLVVLGGEEVVKKDIEIYRQNFSKECILINLFGQSESSITLTNFINQDTLIPRNSVSVGYPVAETEILLLDSDGNCTNIIGEIAIKSPHIALGYWRKPELTDAVFLSDGTGNGRIYRTGDLGRLQSDGSLQFLGRKDFQVKIRGFRIELGEVEAVLNQHPHVFKTVVIVREDIPGDKRLIAYIIPEAQATLSPSELREFLKQKLPDYMIPSAFVQLDKFPLTPNGKINRRALPAPNWEEIDRKTFVVPRTEIEVKIAEIWSQVLDVKNMGVDDNFFDLGGHSLLATQVISRLFQVFGVKLSFISFFTTPTIAGLSQEIEKLRLVTDGYEEGEI